MYLIALVFSAALLAQPSASQPDMSGTWKMDPARSGSPGQTPPVNEMTLVIKQTGSDVQLEWTTGTEKPMLTTYAVVPAPKQPDEPLGADVRRAYWVGNQLVLERGGSISGQTVSMKQSLSLDPERHELLLERLVIVQHGYTLKGTKNYATVKDVFTRVGP